MKLEYKTFENLHKLTEFVNEYGIEKENIQCVVPSAFHTYTLIYWR